MIPRGILGGSVDLNMINLYTECRNNAHFDYSRVSKIFNILISKLAYLYLL